MDVSKYYSKGISKIVKKNHDKDISVFKDDFSDIFVGCCRMLPDGVAKELFERFVTFSDRDFKDAIYNLVNVIELFEENYDVENDPLTDDEWAYLKLVVNDSTEELGLESVKYIMQVMLDLDLIES